MRRAEATRETAKEPGIVSTTLPSLCVQLLKVLCSPTVSLWLLPIPNIL